MATTHYFSPGRLDDQQVPTNLRGENGGAKSCCHPAAQQICRKHSAKDIGMPCGKRFIEHTQFLGHDACTGARRRMALVLERFKNTAHRAWSQDHRAH
jgi:hypothetical protein